MPVTITLSDYQKTYLYEDALEQSVAYFNGNELPANIFLNKYALRDNQQNILEPTPDYMHRRLAREFARVEAGKFAEPMSEDEIYSYLKDFRKIIPQGSPMYGIGNNNQIISLSNCYVLPSPLDSYGSIHRADEQISQISKRRGGCGIDISNLRPNGTTIHNAARTSTGIGPFMERYSNSIREVGQNGRRGALMTTISVHHPEVLMFASIKRDLTKVTGSNISVRLTDEFLDAVENNTEYEQRWPVDAREKGEEPRISQQVNARDVWHEIIENAWSMGEPGLIFWSNVLRESPADCYAEYNFRTICTNPCNELPLSALDSCRLLLLNLFSYVKHPFTKKSYFDFDELYSDAQVAQRLMDNMVDLELEKVDAIINKIKSDPEPEDLKRVELEMWQRIHDTCINGRRTGTGITALGDTIAALGIHYGSDVSIKVTEEIYKTLKLAAYRSSVDMAKELGTFPVWNHELEKECPFIKRIYNEDRKLWLDMKEHGRRNISLLTTAPAGTVSIVAKVVNNFNTSSGIEPQFSIKPYIRKKKINPADEGVRVDETDQTGDHWQHFEVYPSAVSDWMEITGETDITKSPWHGCCAEDLDWPQRVKLQAAAQKHVDHAISSTLNLPEDVTQEKVAEIYEAAWKAGCKGITVYRNNCRTGVLVAKEEVDPNNGHTIPKTTAPKRPKEIDAELHFTRINGENYFIVVGKLSEHEPYEVFVGKNGLAYKRGPLEGKVSRAARGIYHGIFDNDIELESISKYCNEEEEAMTRMVSTALRHGADVSFIVHQLEKTKGDLQSPAKAVSRILKKFIPNGHTVTGEECVECGGELRREEGCVKCPGCGWTKCS